MDPLAYTGLAVGFAFGFALQRGRFCMNSAFRDIIVLRDYAPLKAVGVAILISMIGFAVMSETGVVNISPVPFFWGALILGGFIFGIGMVVAGGCASGITYRSGEGMVGAMAAVIGLVVVGLMTSMGVFKSFVSDIRSHTLVTTDEGANLTLANVLDVPYFALALGIAGGALLLWAVFAIRASRGEKSEEAESVPLRARIFKRGWGWLPAGIVLGVISIVAFYASTEAGRSYPLGITGGYLTTIKSLIMGENLLNWLSMAVMATIVGAFVAAFIADELRLRAPPPRALIQCFFGGCIMGFGAVCAGGCNITHILSGVPQLALSSMLAGAFIILGCWVTAWWMFIRPMRA